MNSITFTAFSDLHYRPGWFYMDGKKSLNMIEKTAVSSNSDFIIHIGDLMHTPSKFPDFTEYYNHLSVPSYHCLGNHEFEADTYWEVLKAYRLEKGYYYFDKSGFRFIVLDTNYMRIGSEAVHYSSGNFLTRPEDSQAVTIPSEEKEWLESSVIDSSFPCILLSHHSFERKHSGISYKEQEQLLSLFLKLNSDKKRIIMAINGHYHRNNLSVRDGIIYFDLNSAYGEWVSPGHTDRFPQEIYDSFRCAKNGVIYKDPLHAVITLREDGYVCIKGMKSEFIYGTDHQSLGLSPFDEDGRKCVAEILSAEIFPA